jgi:hypothetical protein
VESEQQQLNGGGAGLERPVPTDGAEALATRPVDGLVVMGELRTQIAARIGKALDVAGVGRLSVQGVDVAGGRLVRRYAAGAGRISIATDDPDGDAALIAEFCQRYGLRLPGRTGGAA